MRVRNVKLWTWHQQTTLAHDIASHAHWHVSSFIICELLHWNALFVVCLTFGILRSLLTQSWWYSCWWQLGRYWYICPIFWWYINIITKPSEWSLCGDHVNCFMNGYFTSPHNEWNILSKYNEHNLHRLSPWTCSCFYAVQMLILYRF